MNASTKVGYGDTILIFFDKKHKYIIRLSPNKDLHTDYGIIRHDDLIGKKFGDTGKTHIGIEYKIIRPRLWQVVYYGFKRCTQVLYLKDISYIISVSGITSGSRVVEAGIGSGFLTAFLADRVRPDGIVYSYEIKENYIKTARRNLRLAGLFDYVKIKLEDITKGIEEEDLDSVILDMPTPWKVVDHAFEKLRSGGTFVAFVPTVNQMEKTVFKLREAGFIEIEGQELIHRPYSISRDGSRPQSIIVGHTGYIIVGQKP